MDMAGDSSTGTVGTSSTTSGCINARHAHGDVKAMAVAHSGWFCAQQSFIAMVRWQVVFDFCRACGVKQTAVAAVLACLYCTLHDCCVNAFC